MHPQIFQFTFHWLLKLCIHNVTSGFCYNPLSGIPLIWILTSYGLGPFSVSFDFHKVAQIKTFSSLSSLHIIVSGREIDFRLNLFQSSLAIFRLYWTKTHLQTIVDVHSPRLVLYEVRLWLWLQWLVAISILAVWRLESVLQLGKWKKSLMVLLDYNGKMVITDLQWRHLPLHSIQNNIGMVDMTLWNNMDLHNMLPPNFESFFGNFNFLQLQCFVFYQRWQFVKLDWKIWGNSRQ